MREEKRDWYEFTGKSVEEALGKALEELGVEESQIEIEILEEPQKGFLGLGGKEARIKVILLAEGAVREKLEGGEAAARAQAPEETGGETKDSSEIETIVSRVLKLMDIEARVEAKEKADSFVVDVWGEDAALLIGKGGNTLEALQTLVNLCARRKISTGKKVIVDVEGYRKRRKARIEKQAQDKAKEALEKGKSELPAMTAAERKIVHVALRDFEGVRTESVGDEPERRVVIYAEKNKKTSVSRETETENQ